MLHHGAAIDLGEKRHELAGGLGFVLERVEDRPALVVRQSLEHLIRIIVA